MGRDLSFTIIPARFLVTIGHVIALIMCFDFISDSVYAGLGAGELTTSNINQGKYK